VTTASIIGATGLVGSHLLKLLLADGRVSKVLSFGRRKSGVTHGRLEEHQVDFEAPASWASRVTGDVAFSTLGTTAKKAGSPKAQRRVDYDYQLDFAKAAAQNGVKTFVLCSSSAANPSSRIFYSRLKGELDRDVQKLGFARVRIVRPSLLGGERPDFRPGERIGGVILGALNAVGLMRKSREIPGEVVAKAMLNAAFDATPGTRIYTLDEVFEEARRDA
jgi:uncharacterized protein YbjT (DUF2867 family)